MNDRAPEPLIPSISVGTCSTHRRSVLAALPGIVLLPGVLSGCGGGTTTEPPSTVQGTTTVPQTTIDASEVPVGTAKQVKIDGGYVIVAQPTKGEVKAYSAVCTHQGGTVQVVEGMLLRCPLHGAEYDGATGQNTMPPAKRGLDIIPAALDGDRITIG